MRRWSLPQVTTTGMPPSRMRWARAGRSLASTAKYICFTRVSVSGMAGPPCGAAQGGRAAAEFVGRDGVQERDDLVDAVDPAQQELLTAQPARDGAGVLQAQEEAALGQLFGLQQLLLRDVVAQVSQLLQHRPPRPDRLRRGAPG